MELGEDESEVSEKDSSDSTSYNQKLSHLCIFGNCQRGKKGGTDYCRMHNISSIENENISISKVTGNSGLIFAFGFFIILIIIILSPSESSADSGIGGLFDDFIWILWGFVFLCASIVFLLISGVSKNVGKK